MKTETTFNLNRDGSKGTKEWSDKSYNICIGCEHGCLYCYAKSRRCRFEAPMRIPGNWEKQRINPRIDKFGAEVQPVGTVMFPTPHDITPQFAPESLRTIKNLVQKNDVLIVTKPHMSVLKILCHELAEHQNRILFQFTIGSLNAELCKFWEPGTPTPAQRVAALEHAYKKDSQRV